jgi:hypothetical protein
MDSLQMLRKLGTQKLQGLVRAYLDTLRPPLSIFLAEITNERIIMILRIKARNLSRTGLPALSTGSTKASISVYDHILQLFIIMYHTRLHRTGLLTLPFFFRTLGADGLD